MKKTCKFFITVILICSLLFVFCINAFALQYDFSYDEHMYLKTPASIYFAGLKETFPYNQKGTCTIVSIAMLLSFYDAYWSDDFLPEEYEYKDQGRYYISRDGGTVHLLESPGVLKEPKLGEDVSYDNFIANYYEEHFQLMLIRMAKNDCDLYEDDVPIFPNSDSEGTIQSSKYSLSHENMKDLLDYYLYEFVGFGRDQITICSMDYRSNSDEEMLEQLRQNMISGIPTIYDAKYEANTSGHSMIAYDYNDNGDDNPSNDEIVFHMGWHKTPEGDDRIKKYNDSDFNYKLKMELIWLEINESAFPHSCSDNFKNRYTLEYECMCKFEFHPKHTHTVYYSGFTSSNHTRGCDYCNEVITEQHTYRYRKISEVQHTGTCACGASTTSVHIVKKGTNKCVLCLANVENGNVALGIVSPSISINNTNDILSTYLAENGIIILSEFDYNLFLAGELTIEEIYERVGMNYG